MSDRDDILADRLNVEPAIFKGCSSSELGIIVGVAALIWLPVSLLLAWLMGAVTMGFGIAGVSGFICIGLGMILSFQDFVLPSHNRKICPSLIAHYFVLWQGIS